MKTAAVVSLVLLLGAFSAAAEAPARLPGLVYHPEGDAIVIENGTRWDNRPLYGHERFAILRSGEQPGVTGPMGRLYTLIARGDTRLALHQFQQRTARYRAGRMEWEVSDARLPGLTARLVITTLANADGCTARLIADGVRPGDLAGWALAPPGVEKGSQYQVQDRRQRVHARPRARRQTRPNRRPFLVAGHPLGTGRMEKSRHPRRTRRTRRGADQGCLTHRLGAARRPEAAVCRHRLRRKRSQFYAAIVRREKPLDPAAIADPAKAFAAGLARVKAYGNQVVVDTPDPYFNAAVSASAAAAIGLFVDPVFVHGGSSWRNQQPGWRTMGAAYNYGFHDR